MTRNAFWAVLVIFALGVGIFLWNMSQDLESSIGQMDSTIAELQQTIQRQAAQARHKAKPGSLHSAPKELTDIPPIPEPVIVNYRTAPLSKPGADKADAFLRLVFDRNKRPDGMKSFASVWTINLKPGGKNGPHAHGDEEQIYICLEGNVQFTFGRKHTYMLKPGDAVFLPKLYSHEVLNTTNKPARLLAVGAYDVD